MNSGKKSYIAFRRKQFNERMEAARKRGATQAEINAAIRAWNKAIQVADESECRGGGIANASKHFDLAELKIPGA